MTCVNGKKNEKFEFRAIASKLPGFFELGFGQVQKKVQQDTKHKNAPEQPKATRTPNPQCIKNYQKAGHHKHRN